MKFAIIDIGSNSVRLMLWADGKTLYKKLKTTRLGAGLASNGSLSEEAIARSVSAVCDFCTEAEGFGKTFSFATAAVRSASNGKEFCDRVKAACGLEVDVISGEHEALLGLYGALGDSDGGILDIGGASTEVCFRRGGRVTFSTSIDLGAVRLYDLCRDDKNKLEVIVGKSLCALNGAVPFGTLYAVGGTASTLAALKLGLKHYDAEKLQDTALSFDWSERTSYMLLRLTPQERGELSGMEKGREDIIAGGAFLFSRILQKLGLTEARFSDRDNLEGYLLYRGLI